MEMAATALCRTRLEQYPEQAPWKSGDDAFWNIQHLDRKKASRKNPFRSRVFGTRLFTVAKPLRIVLGLVLGVLLAGFVLYETRWKEPAYQGKSLSEWLAMFDKEPSDEQIQA